MESKSYSSNLPDELWLKIFKNFHPIYDNIFHLALVCRQWRNIIIKAPDPCLWETIELANIRNCYLDSPFLSRFTFILTNFGKYVKVLRLRRCHSYFTDALKGHARRLCSLQFLEIKGTSWNKKILKELSCYKTLKNIEIEAADGDLDRTFREQDFCRLIENFPRLDQISLQYSTFKRETLSYIQDLVTCRYSSRITDLQIERAKIDPLDLNEVVQNLQGLKSFTYGNDQIHGLPSIQCLALESKSIKEMNLFQIGDFAEFRFDLPHLQKLTINLSTSLQTLTVYAPSLRVLDLVHCSELRKLSKVSSTSLHEVKIRRCSALSSSELIRFLVQNPDIKKLDLEVCFANLRLDQNSNPSLEMLSVFDSGCGLISLDIRCPKLRVLTFMKSLIHSSLLKVVAIRSEEMDSIVIRNVPHLRKLILNASKVKHLELDFDRRVRQIKPASFTTIHFQSNLSIGMLVLKKLNIRSIVINKCYVKQAVMDLCNLDASLTDMLDHFYEIESLALQNCHGPCQITVQNDSLKELQVSSCTSVLMDHINVLCPLLERLCVHGTSILPSKKEVESTAKALKKVCPQLLDVNFSH
ncbi:uncharacterized protein LOC116305983 [Actinia tenebrosa]|uniref:Uncharacterized protein LOC116305983 n=1 Tax=Actinia tenebrosa TaxID=6105 RepID=A0A6P8J151_ACTTE|nr:uncharacterized protein LOC116305983 [Actinia tenebrosa]